MPRKRTSRQPLSRERVLTTALAMVDEGGLEALSIRKLAGELGVEAMSLYNHVKNKEDLVSGMLEIVAGEIEFDDVGGDWRSALRSRTIAAHQAFVRRPWAARIWMSSMPSIDRFAQSDA